MGGQKALGDGGAQGNRGGLAFSGRVDCHNLLVSDLDLRVTGQAPLTEPLIGKLMRLKANTVG